MIGHRANGAAGPRRSAALWLTLLAACNPRSPSPTAPAAVDPTPLGVSVVEVRAHPWFQSIDTFGRFVAAEKLTLGVEVAGTVTEVLFSEGQHIEAGQTLVRLDDRKQRLRLERARADAASASVELGQARSTFERYQELIERRVVAEEAYRQTESAYQAAQARLEQAIAAREIARQELRDLTLSSPVAGIVESEAVEPGQKVLPGDTLAVIQTASSLQVLTYVREEEVNLLHPGDAAPVQSPGVPGRLYQARIESIASAADPRTGNFAIKLRVDNQDGLLREGMSARISLRSQQGMPVLTVPAGAVVDRDRRRVVFLVRDGLAASVAPVLGLAADGWVPVTGGLAAGDRVIVDPIALVADGKRVRVTATQADPLPEAPREDGPGSSGGSAPP